MFFQKSESFPGLKLFSRPRASKATIKLCKNKEIRRPLGRTSVRPTWWGKGLPSPLPPSLLDTISARWQKTRENTRKMQNWAFYSCFFGCGSPGGSPWAAKPRSLDQTSNPSPKTSKPGPQTSNPSPLGWLFRDFYMFFGFSTIKSVDPFRGWDVSTSARWQKTWKNYKNTKNCALLLF